MAKYFVVKEIGSEDSKPFAVVEHGRALDGKWSRNCLFVLGWYAKEDEARASAHTSLYPEYD